MPSAAYLSADATVSAHRAAAITPNNTLVYEQPTRGIYVGGAGNITAEMPDTGASVLFVGLLAGVVYPFQVTRVYSTGTTATNLVALY
jgi:hypothetical protein